MRNRKLYTVKDLCLASGYTRQGISLLVKQGKIKSCFRTERLLVFSEKEYQRILERLKRGKYVAFKD